MPTIDQSIRAAARRLTQSTTPLLDARVLAKRAFRLDDAELILRAEHSIRADEAARLEALVRRREKGESVAHILGEKEFYGLPFRLAPGVLAPRPESETLVAAAAARRDRAARLAILDLGVGSGCLLCALLAEFPKATGFGVDVNEAAARLARENAARLGLGPRTNVAVGNWFDPFSQRFDLIVSNPPYIRAAARAGLAPEIRDFEDPRALFAGADGLGAYRAILRTAPERLRAGGLMILELGEAQDGAVMALAARAFPAAALGVDHDLAGRPRALVIDLSQQKKV